MRYLYLFKVVILIFMLVGVIFVIRHLTADKVQKGLDALGIDANSQGLSPVSRPGSTSENRLTLCRARIASIDLHGWHLDEQGGLKKDWVATKGDQKRVLDYIEMEKWLSQTCQIIATGDNALGVQPKPDVMMIKFVDKSETEIVFDATKANRFKINGQWLMSDYLKDAIERLLKLVGS